MTIGTIRIPIDHCTSRIELRFTLTGVKGWRCRIWIACRLISLAGWVSGVKTFVDIVERDTTRVPPPRPAGAPPASRPTR